MSNIKKFWVYWEKKDKTRPKKGNVLLFNIRSYFLNVRLFLETYIALADMTFSAAFGAAQPELLYPVE